MGVAKLFDFRAYGAAGMLEFFRALDHIRRVDTDAAMSSRLAQLATLKKEMGPLEERQERLVLEACTFVRFSSAAYTGWTHDLLRMAKRMNPFITLRRQELFRSAFGRKSTREGDAIAKADSTYILARVKGDNFWAGHTRAFARYVKNTPNQCGFATHPTFLASLSVFRLETSQDQRVASRRDGMTGKRE